MFALSVAVIILASAACGQDEGFLVFDNKTQCINAMVEWCDNMKYPQEGAGMAMLSVSYFDSNRSLKRVFCSSDSDGTNCTQNGNAWFNCSPDNKLLYKGKPLTKDSSDVDDDICKTADKAFNALFVQNLSYDNTSLKKEVEKGMESFFEEMAAMQEQISAIHDFLKRLPFFGNSWPDDGFFGNPWPPVDRREWMTDSPNGTELTTNSPNQIEKE